jgi:hypothetical protein
MIDSLFKPVDKMNDAGILEKKDDGIIRFD